MDFVSFLGLVGGSLIFWRIVDLLKYHLVSRNLWETKQSVQKLLHDGCFPAYISYPRSISCIRLVLSGGIIVTLVNH